MCKCAWNPWTQKISHGWSLDICLHVTRIRNFNIPTSGVIFGILRFLLRAVPDVPFLKARNNWFYLRGPSGPLNPLKLNPSFPFIFSMSSYFLEHLAEAFASVPLELFVLITDFLPVDSLVTGELLCHEAGQHSFNPQPSRSCLVLQEPGLQNPGPTISHWIHISSNLFD